MADWEFTADGAKIGQKEFKLREATTGEVLQRYGIKATEDSEVYKVIISAIGALSGAQGDVNNLLDRVRKTVRARDSAHAELGALASIFDAFFEPAGISDAIGDEKKLSQFAMETVRRFSRRK